LEEQQLEGMVVVLLGVLVRCLLENQGFIIESGKL
jgi:hypothetical protein